MRSRQGSFVYYDFIHTITVALPHDSLLWAWRSLMFPFNPSFLSSVCFYYPYVSDDEDILCVHCDIDSSDLCLL